MKRFIVLICVLANVALGQATYYVRNGGDDAKDGRSDRTAFATLSRIHSVSLTPGDSVLFKRGSRWCETLNIANASGTKQKPIVYGAYGTGDLPVIDEERAREYGINASYTGLSHVRFENLAVTGSVVAGVFYNESGSVGLVCDSLYVHHNLNHGITLRRADSVIVQNCTVFSNGYTPAPGNPVAHGIYVSVCQGALVQHNTVDSAQGAGIHAYECLNTTIRYNTSQRCGLIEKGTGDGILIWTDQPATVDCYYNYVCNNVRRGITVRECAAGSTINLENNTIVTTQGSGLFIYQNPAGVTVNARNNIVAFNTGYDLEISSASSTTVLDYNLYYGTSGTMATFNGTRYPVTDLSGLKAGILGAHSIQRDPLFVDIAQSPAIKPASPCRDAGVNVGLTQDIGGAKVDSALTGRVDIGSFEVVKSAAAGVAAPGNQGPAGYALLQNYPNPFNPMTQIPFQLKENGHVTLIVYDVLGREVATPANGEFSAGMHLVSFAAGQLPSGAYYVRMQTDGFSAARTMLLVK